MLVVLFALKITPPHRKFAQWALKVIGKPVWGHGTAMESSVRNSVPRNILDMILLVIEHVHGHDLIFSEECWERERERENKGTFSTITSIRQEEPTPFQETLALGFLYPAHRRRWFSHAHGLPVLIPGRFQLCLIHGRIIAVVYFLAYLASDL